DLVWDGQAGGDLLYGGVVQTQGEGGSGHCDQGDQRTGDGGGDPFETIDNANGRQGQDQLQPVHLSQCPGQDLQGSDDPGCFVFGQGHGLLFDIGLGQATYGFQGTVKITDNR